MSEALLWLGALSLIVSAIFPLSYFTVGLLDELDLLDSEDQQ